MLLGPHSLRVKTRVRGLWPLCHTGEERKVNFLCVFFVPCGFEQLADGLLDASGVEGWHPNREEKGEHRWSGSYVASLIFLFV